MTDRLFCYHERMYISEKDKTHHEFNSKLRFRKKDYSNLDTTKKVDNQIVLRNISLNKQFLIEPWFTDKMNSPNRTFWTINV